MGKVGHRVGVGLGVIEVVHAGEVTPAWVAPDLDQAGPEHDPEYQPPVAEYTDLNKASTTKDAAFNFYLWRGQFCRQLPP